MHKNEAASMASRLAIVAYALAMAMASACGSRAQVAPGQPAQAGTPPPNRNGSPVDLPLTGKQRAEWAAVATVGPRSLLVGVLGAGLGTAENAPPEYGPSWAGFGSRYGMRLTGVATGNAMEAGLGALWNEDPRYFAAIGQPFTDRVRNIVKMTFLTRRADGQEVPAYARFAAIPGSSFLSNAWRVRSEASAGDAALRVLWGFLERMGSNAVAEFWPDIRVRIAPGSSPGHLP